jgi:apolipoprotein N-acyltransferase
LPPDRTSPAAIGPLVLSSIGAAIGGTLYFLGFLGFGGWPLLGIFLVPFWWSLDRASRQGRLAPMGVGFVFGFVAYAGGHVWLLRLVDVFLSGDVVLGGALWLLYGLAFAGGFAAYGLLYGVLRRRGAGLATAGVATWVGLEWLQPWPFPVHAGAALIDALPLVQIADLGGTLLLGGLIGAGNLLIFETSSWLAGHRVRPLRVWGVVGGCFVLTLVYGAIRTDQLERRIDQAASLRVGIVQANLGPLEKRSQAVVGHRQHLEQTRALLAESPVDLVVWPETAFMRALRGPLPLSGRLVAGEIEVPLLFGATLLDHSGMEPVQFNSALLIARDGMIRDAYRKNLLIPIAEFVPFRGLLPGLDAALPHAQHFRASQDTSPLRLDDWRIAVAICYEAVRPAFVRRLVEKTQANLLVTLANDAWFGDSQEPRIHLQLARMRAVENRLYLVRATNSGSSAIVDPLGRFVTQSGVLERANLHGVVRRMDERSLYSRLGDWPGLLAVVAIFIGAWRLMRRSTSGTSPADRGA